MAARLLLPVHDAPRLSVAETDLLREVASAGLASLRGIGPAEHEAFPAGAQVVYRRWVLDVLLLLRARGAMGFGEISRALGRLAGESLAPKLQLLEAEGLVLREPGETPRRVSYRLASAGRPIADGAYALTTVKREHTRAVLDGVEPQALLAGLQVAPPGPPLARFERAVGDFAQAHLTRAPASPDEQLRIARRFAETCVRKWHGEILSTLLARGPMRFSDLRDALGAGDQALANALSALERFEAAERSRASWAVTPLGALDVAVGAPLVLLTPRMRALRAG